MRPIEIGRQEAEYLVNLIEIDENPQFVGIAADLRKQWGMVSKEREDACRDGLLDEDDPLLYLRTIS